MIGSISSSSCAENRQLPIRKSKRIAEFAAPILQAPPAKTPRMLKELEPVHEMLRDDAFLFQLQKSSLKLREKFEGEDLPLEEAVFKKTYQKKVEEVKAKRSERLSNQLYDLFLILRKNRSLTSARGERFIAFADNIISQVKERQPGEAEKVLLGMLDSVDIKMSDAEKAKCAQAFTKGDDIEDGVQCKQMAYLLLVMDSDIDYAENCLALPNALELFADFTQDHIEARAKKLAIYDEALEKTALQDRDEALFNRLAYEMADLLLLKTGSFNFGLIEDVYDLLFPERFSGTEADKHLLLILTDIEHEPIIWEKFRSIKTPLIKNQPSDIAVKAGLRVKTYTQREAQLLIVSSLFASMRQARAGTCFATAWILKALYQHLPFMLDDLIDAVEKGEISRVIIQQNRVFPFTNRMTNEYTDTLVHTDKEGLILSTEKYGLSEYEKGEWTQPKGKGYLYEAPGIKAACLGMGIEDQAEAIRASLPLLPQPFAVKELLKCLAQIAFRQQLDTRPSRSEARLSPDELYERGEYYYCSETNHPLHRAYEQMLTSFVDAFGTQYSNATWTFERVRKLLKSKSTQPVYQKLLKELYLPMTTRMRYRYNHNLDDNVALFNDGNLGVSDHHSYGYELFDGGLPENFTYSTEVYDQIKSDCHFISIPQFGPFPPVSTWKPINTKEKFLDFLQDLIEETSFKLSRKNKDYALAGEQMIREIRNPAFIDKLLKTFLGRDKTQEKDVIRNEHDLVTTPWLYRWGGSYDQIMKNFFGLNSAPNKMKEFIGTPKEVLAKLINTFKDQPKDIQESLQDPHQHILTSSPCHAFLITPASDAFRAAYLSPLPAADYIHHYLEVPSSPLSHQRYNLRERHSLIDFILNNRWYSRKQEKKDLERLKLTPAAQAALANLITPEMTRLSRPELLETLSRLIPQARGFNNPIWENKANLALKHFTGTNEELIHFAINLDDTVKLQPRGQALFKSLMDTVPPGLSLKGFRDACLANLKKARYADTFLKDPSWLKAITAKIDTFMMKNHQLPVIITHDSNWKVSTHYVYMAFTYNPCSAQIELCQYIPDTKQIHFFPQEDWFPANETGYRWNIPDNFRYYKNTPPFKYEEL